MFIDEMKGLIDEAKRILELLPESDYEGPDQNGYKANAIKRSYLQDIVIRISTILISAIRLHDLSTSWHAMRKEINKHPVEGSEGSYHIPPEIVEQQDQWEVEAELYTNFVIYETTSLKHVLRQINIEYPGNSELVYATKVRDRFLSHSRLFSVSRGIYKGYSVPEKGLVLFDSIALSSVQKIHLTTSEWKGEVNTEEWSKKREENEKAVLSKTKNEQLSPSQIKNLLAYGVRPVSLETVFDEFLVIMKTHIMPIIKAESDKAIHKYNFIVESDLFE